MPLTGETKESLDEIERLIERIKWLAANLAPLNDKHANGILDNAHTCWQHLEMYRRKYESV